MGWNRDSLGLWGEAHVKTLLHFCYVCSHFRFPGVGSSEWSSASELGAASWLTLFPRRCAPLDFLLTPPCSLDFREEAVPHIKPVYGGGAKMPRSQDCHDVMNISQCNILFWSKQCVFLSHSPKHLLQLEAHRWEWPRPSLLSEDLVRPEGLKGNAVLTIWFLMMLMDKQQSYCSARIHIQL